MRQLGKLPTVIAELESRDVAVVAVTNEETSMEEHAKLRDHFEGDVPFHHAPDFGGEATKDYEPTTCYLIDAKGVIRQVFPMEIYERPPWWSLITGIDEALED